MNSNERCVSCLNAHDLALYNSAAAPTPDEDLAEVLTRLAEEYGLTEREAHIVWVHRREEIIKHGLQFVLDDISQRIAAL